MVDLRAGPQSSGAPIFSAGCRTPDEAGVMTFDHVWVLFLLPLPFVLLLWDWRKVPSRPGLVVKVCAFLAIILALASPRMDVDATKVATVVLADTSASLSQSDLQRYSKLVGDIESQRG